MLFEFETISGLHVCTNVLTLDHKDSVDSVRSANNFIVSPDTYNRLLSELRASGQKRTAEEESEPEPEPEPEPQVSITCLCWVKSRNGTIRPIPRRSRGFRYHWFIFDSGYVDDNGIFAESFEDGRDVVQVGEPLTDPEIMAAARGETLTYTGTMLK